MHCLVELRLKCRGGGSRRDGSTESRSQKRGPGVRLGGVTPKEAGGRRRFTEVKPVLKAHRGSLAQAGLDVLGVIPAAYLATN